MLTIPTSGTRITLWLFLLALNIIFISSGVHADNDLFITPNKICKKDSNIFTNGALIQCPPSRSSKPRPFPLMGSSAKPYCFRDLDRNHEYGTFDDREWKKVLGKLCDKDTLSPNEGWRNYVSPDGIVAWVAYAQDQSGCSAKSTFDLRDRCMKCMDDLVRMCDGPGLDKGPGAFGGGLVEKGPSGCIEYYVARPMVPGHGPR